MISAVLHYASQERTIHISEATTYIELLNVHLADVYNPSLSYTDEEGEKVRFNSPAEWREAIKVAQSIAPSVFQIFVQPTEPIKTNQYANIRLSSDVSTIKSHYEIVVIGSGYGGGILASRLSRAGRQVCLLERGKEKWPGEYPDSLVSIVKDMQFDSPVWPTRIGNPTAMLDFRRNDVMWVMTGCGLGGTSLVNANVTIKPDKRVFSKFPKEILEDWNTMEQGFELTREWLEPNTFPDSIQLRKSQALKRQSTKVEATFHKADLNVSFRSKVSKGGIKQEACTNCGNCVTGCNYGAKNTTLMNYLPDAHTHGTIIFTEVAVRYIEKEGEKWRLRCRVYEDGKEPTDFSITCDVCVVAAGCLGSTEILLRSKEKGLGMSDMVGKKFTSNGDVMGFAYNGNAEVDGIGYPRNSEKVPPCGPTITSCCDMRYDSKPLEEGYLVEDGAIPNGLASIVPELFAASSAIIGQKTPGGDWVAQEYRELQSITQGAHYGATNNSQTFLFMGHDKGNGYMHLKDDHLRIEWPDKEGIFKKANDVMYDLCREDSAIFVSDPLYQKMSNFNLITVHPLGGVVMGSDAQSGAVNHAGKLYKTSQGTEVYDSLYVCDGSVIPTPLGVNPLYTICAICERIAMLIAKERGWKIDMSGQYNIDF